MCVTTAILKSNLIKSELHYCVSLYTLQPAHTFFSVLTQFPSKLKYGWQRCRTSFFVITPTRCTNFTNLFCHETLHVSDSSSVHHQQFIHCTLSNGVCHTGLYTAFEQGQALLESCIQTCMTYTIAECTVNKCWWWTDELSETCRVSWQNKFVKLVHLVGFITKKRVTMHGHTNVKFL